MGCASSSSAPNAPPACVEPVSEAGVHQEFTFSTTKLGAGAFGAVVSAVDARTQQPVAMKQIRKAGLADQHLSIADVYREAEIAVAMSACAHVVRHARCFETDEHIYLAMEPVTRGDPSRRYFHLQPLEWPSTSRRGPSRTSPHKVRSSACARPPRLRPT